MSDGGKKVWVCPVVRRDTEIAHLKRQITALGGDLVCDGKQTLEGYEECVEAAEVIVILICPESINDPTIQDIVEMASRLGKRIVGVWLDEEVIGDVPGFLEREGNAVIGMTNEGLRRAVLEDEAIWIEPSGIARQPQRVPRHKGH
jgi:hypothetical protein